jgi:predicted NodU family carbamoyl transferase
MTGRSGTRNRTSFNVMGKPILNSAEEAAGMLFTTGLDAVVIHDFLVEAGRGAGTCCPADSAGSRPPP